MSTILTILLVRSIRSIGFLTISYIQGRINHSWRGAFSHKRTRIFSFGVQFSSQKVDDIFSRRRYV